MTDINENLKEKLNHIGGFIEHNNYKISEISDGYCVMIAEIGDTSLNPFNMAHGGFVFGLCDTAAGAACVYSGRKAVTVSSNITYFKPAVGKYIKAVAKCVKLGKSISMFEVDVYNDKEVVVAKAMVEYFYI